jgi:hypothetical protein
VSFSKRLWWIQFILTVRNAEDLDPKDLKIPYRNAKRVYYKAPREHGSSNLAQNTKSNSVRLYFFQYNFPTAVHTPFVGFDGKIHHIHVKPWAKANEDSLIINSVYSHFIAVRYLESDVISKIIYHTNGFVDGRTDQLQGATASFDALPEILYASHHYLGSNPNFVHHRGIYIFARNNTAVALAFTGFQKHEISVYGFPKFAAGHGKQFLPAVSGTFRR